MLVVVVDSSIESFYRCRKSCVNRGLTRGRIKKEERLFFSSNKKYQLNYINYAIMNQK